MVVEDSCAPRHAALKDPACVPLQSRRPVGVGAAGRHRHRASAQPSGTSRLGVGVYVAGKYGGGAGGGPGRIARPAGCGRLIVLQCAPVAQLDRASASGAEGHRFESCRARHFNCKHHNHLLRGHRRGSVAIDSTGRWPSAADTPDSIGNPTALDQRRRKIVQGIPPLPVTCLAHGPHCAPAPGRSGAWGEGPRVTTRAVRTLRTRLNQTPPPCPGTRYREPSTRDRHRHLGRSRGLARRTVSARARRRDRRVFTDIGAISTVGSWKRADRGRAKAQADRRDGAERVGELRPDSCSPRAARCGQGFGVGGPLHVYPTTPTCWRRRPVHGRLCSHWMLRWLVPRDQSASESWS